ncbi:MAG: hypothetical protein AVDCRST_MAG65-196, partial [uncultured Solirubrobacteraceae bacterium]
GPDPGLPGRRRLPVGHAQLAHPPGLRPEHLRHHGERGLLGPRGGPPRRPRRPAARADGQARG